MVTSKEIQKYISQIESDIQNLQNAKKQALNDLCEAYHKESNLKIGDIVDVRDKLRGIYLGFRVNQYNNITPVVAHMTDGGLPKFGSTIYILDYQPGMLKKVN